MQRWRGVVRAAKWVVGRVLRLVPERIVGRMLPEPYRFTAADVPPPTRAPEASTRLYIAPVNYAGQAWQWARAAERNTTGVGAVTVAARAQGGFSHPADAVVPIGVYAASRSWQRAEFAAVSSGFTHVLIEAVKPPFGAVLDETTEGQVYALRKRGVSVAMVCHGTEIRLPSRHIDRYPDSPFTDSLAEVAPLLEHTALRNRKTLDALGLPVFVTTPDLVLDVPYATWLPSIVDPSLWSTDAPVLERRRPVVVHAPSSDATKGSELIDPIMNRLHDDGVITYRRVSGVPFASMPQVFQDADIVIDQVRFGDYDVVALEAMAAGRVVVGHVSDHTRSHVVGAFGTEVPVVEARPHELADVVRQVVDDRDRFRAIAAAGKEFVTRFHDGRESSRVLSSFLR